MAKKEKKVQDVELEVKTKKVRVKAKKEGKKVNVVVDTPKVDAELHIDETKKEFKYDGQKLGNWLAKFYTKKFNKTK